MELKEGDRIQYWSDEFDSRYRIIKNDRAQALPRTKKAFQRLMQKVQRRHPKLMVLDIKRRQLGGQKYPPAQTRFFWSVTVRNKAGRELTVTEEGNAFPMKKLDPKLVLACL